MEKPTRVWFAELLEREIETWEAAARRCDMLVQNGDASDDWDAKARRYRQNATDLRETLEILRKSSSGEPV
jgi:hypothetical protein